MTSVNDIRNWLQSMRSLEATHMIVKCDTYDWTDYPIYVTPNQDVRKVDEDNPDRTMEVYSAKLTDEEQLSERRAFHYD